jgi:hypothetical protein
MPFSEANLESSDAGLGDMAADTNPPLISAIPPMFDSSQQTLCPQDNRHTQGIKAQIPPLLIFDCISDDDLSDAPSPSPPEPRPLPLIPQVRVANFLASDISMATSEASANKLVRPAPVREPRGSPYKRRKIEQTAAKTTDMTERTSPNVPSNARRTQRSPNTYKGTRKPPRPLGTTGHIDDSKSLSDQTDFDDIPSAQPDSKLPSNQKAATPKKRGRSSRRNAARRDGRVSQSNNHANNQESDMKSNSASTLKHPTRRIMSDLEPALSQSIARTSLRTPTSVRKAMHADVAQKQYDQNSLKDASNQDSHKIRGLPASTSHVDLTLGHQPVSNPQIVDVLASPTSLDDVTLVQGGDILEARPSGPKVNVQTSVAEPSTKAHVIVRIA